LVKNPLVVIGQNFAVAAAAHVAARLLNLALLAIVARTLGVEGIGDLAVAFAVGTATLFATDLGLAARLVRETSARHSCENDAYARALGAKLALTPVALAAAALIYAAAPLDRSVAPLCALAAAAAAIESITILNHAVCRSYERFDLEAIGEILHAVVLITAGGVALLGGFPLIYVGVAAIVAAVVELAVSFALARRFVNPSVVWPRDLALLSNSLPYTATSVGVAALAQLDVLVLAAVAPQSEVGRYAAVSRLLLGGAYFVGLAADVALPRATETYIGGAGARFDDAACEGARAALLAGGAATVVIVAAARPLMSFVYGSTLAASFPLLQLGAVFLFLKLAGAAPRTALTAADRQPAHARSVVCGLVATAAAIATLGARYGALGAVVALIVGEAVALIAALVASRGLWRPRGALPTAAMVAVTAAAAIAVILLMPTSELGAGAVGTGLYALGVGVSGELSRALAFARRAGRARPLR
jgi:O-antigen/teichoic acid export membrane protein